MWLLLCSMPEDEGLESALLVRIRLGAGRAWCHVLKYRLQVLQASGVWRRLSLQSVVVTACRARFWRQDFGSILPHPTGS